MFDHTKIVVTPPGPRGREIVQKDEQLISPSYNRFYPLVVESGRGYILKDVDGNEYIDFASGLLCLNVGHCHPKVVEAIKRQCDSFLHVSNAFYSSEIVNLAEQLAKITPGEFAKKTFFGNSGSEAIEASLKLSKWYTRKSIFIGFINAFHGGTLSALAFASIKPSQRAYFSPFMPSVAHIPYPYCYRCPFKLSYPECDYWCVDFIEEYVLQKYVPPEDVAAILFEPIQSDGGVIVPPPEYFQLLKKLADKHGILLIADEVQTGIGRTGKWFAIEHWNVAPEILCCGGALASGLPLSATIAKAKIMDWISGSHTSTFGGNPLACAAAIAVIDVIKEERLLENANKQGAYIMKRLAELKDKSSIVGDIRGKGLIIGIEVIDSRESNKQYAEKSFEIVARLWKRGVITTTCGLSTVRIAPPLNITKEAIDAALEIIEDTIKEVEKEG